MMQSLFSERTLRLMNLPIEPEIKKLLSFPREKIENFTDCCCGVIVLSATSSLAVETWAFMLLRALPVGRKEYKLYLTLYYLQRLNIVPAGVSMTSVGRVKQKLAGKCSQQVLRICWNTSKMLVNLHLDSACQTSQLEWLESVEV